MTNHEKIMGPVDYLMIRFPGNKFTGKIAPELIDLEKKGIIRIIDLVMILKDANGKLGIVEAKNLEGEAGAAYRELAKRTDEWFSEGDIEALATSLANNTSAALLLFENVWAIKFKAALLEADAELIDMGRIPPETIAKAEKHLKVKGGA
ncbi:MAG: hypothetical protein BWY93_00162 [Euryarchaeota archaeon ADurb.BinA087]|nr:MAG: hypothetical protein BWY93_00162 [Euryarchaeota archaeon ADurb.BinA087]